MIDPIPLYHKMLQAMGPQHWWPADSKMEIVIGAILVQNTNWANVDLALANLRQATNLDPKQILKLSREQIEQLIHPSGFYRNKSRSFLEVLRWFDQGNYRFDQMSTHYGSNLRKTLLSLPGVGEETADSLIVYVFDQPTFIADKYARKLFKYLGCKDTSSYHKLQTQIQLPTSFGFKDAQEFHGLIDEFGKLYLKNEQQFGKSFLKDFKLMTIKFDRSD